MNNTAMNLIAFICRGNTCRSPLAEALARRALVIADPGLGPNGGPGAGIAVVSAGVAVDRTGAPADPRAVAVALRHGLDLDAHRATGLSDDIVQGADLLVALDTRTHAEILERFMCDSSRVVILMPFAPALGVIDVADPYNGTGDDYERAFELISAGIDGLVDTIRQGRM